MLNSACMRSITFPTYRTTRFPLELAMISYSASFIERTVQSKTHVCFLQYKAFCTEQENPFYYE